MLAVLNPKQGIHYQPGDVFFTRSPDVLLSDLIDLVTHGPSHTGFITEYNTAIAATWPHVKRFDLKEYFKDDQKLVWVRRIRGMTSTIAREVCLAAAQLIGRDYDLGGMVCFPWGGLNRKDAYFCSELVASVLRIAGPMEVRHLFIDKAPGEWSPADLHRADIWED